MPLKRSSYNRVFILTEKCTVSKAEQLRVAVCRGSFVLSLAVLNKKNGELNQRSVFVKFGKQLKSCTKSKYI
ncbi:hypothetical protein T01_14371 [Trichinella spiralis]|uniref:Uncharacterized protein n=1 Tax=Trichinella spiralis TaxID=6334 RepID=A0A0V1BAJ0_TRISP|nr:hypothetical protein T01_14371 [Trichinella spiralis]